MPATLSNGKICYVEIPALDDRRSADFYEKVFGWRIAGAATGPPASTTFLGGRGAWVLGRPPANAPGRVIYIMVDDVAATLESVLARGEIAQAIGADAPGITARFRDPPECPRPLSSVSARLRHGMPARSVAR
jgi:uncharacterized protein